MEEGFFSFFFFRHDTCDKQGLCLKTVLFAFFGGVKEQKTGSLFFLETLLIQVGSKINTQSNRQRRKSSFLS